jgi:hypothetical protein
MLRQIDIGINNTAPAGSATVRRAFPSADSRHLSSACRQVRTFIAGKHSALEPELKIGSKPPASTNDTASEGALW